MTKVKKTFLIILVLLVGLFLVLSQFMRIPYVLKQASFQAELLWGRIPIEEAMQHHQFTETQLENLHRLPKIKAFGKKFGLRATENYSTINPTFTRTIWNVSACDPLAFEPQRWWFPIVGRVPYLGFFEKDAAQKEIEALSNQGFDTYLRTAGAYSTLGWFEDPLLPNMLNWNEYAFANTVLHELAHATVWLPGSVQFNESFANFVGDTASMKYMVDTYGEDSDEVRKLRHRLSDRKKFRRILVRLYADLNEVFQNPSYTDDEKWREKRRLYAELEQRVRHAELFNEAGYLKRVQTDEWNNARMMQFRTYNRSREWFQKLYDHENKDMDAFIRHLERIVSDGENPYKALESAIEAM